LWHKGSDNLSIIIEKGAKNNFCKPTSGLQAPHKVSCCQSLPQISEKVYDWQPCNFLPSKRVKDFLHVKIRVKKVPTYVKKNTRTGSVLKIGVTDPFISG
jgi:hypothetical protein